MVGDGEALQKQLAAGAKRNFGAEVAEEPGERYR
jgi:hypothetical protein